VFFRVEQPTAGNWKRQNGVVVVVVEGGEVVKAYGACE